MIRQAVELGHFAVQDDFAYTPTLSPIVHHEWGTGAVLYCLTRFAGPAGVFFWQHFSYFVFAGGPAIAGAAAWVWLMAEVYDLALARRRKVLLNDDDSSGIDKQPVATSG